MKVYIIDRPAGEPIFIFKSSTVEIVKIYDNNDNLLYEVNSKGELNEHTQDTNK